MKTKLFSPATISLSRHSNNFDFLRLFAASLVIIAHSSTLLLNKPLPIDPIQLLFGMEMGHFGVIVFFVISGFLITMSWVKRKNLVNFLWSRFLRIYPAAIVVVLLSVFVLGLFLTTNTLTEYFHSKITHHYLQNITLYRMYYYLPGIFSNNPYGSSINGSLWTLSYEFTCYLFLGLFGVLTLLKNKFFGLILFIALLLLNQFFPSQINKIIIPILGIDFKTFYPLLLFFMAGAMFYQFRDYLYLNVTGALGSVLLIFIFKGTTISHYIQLLLIPYIVFAIAFSKQIPLNNTGKYGDFSYGLYLYAFPVQQLIVYLTPARISLVAMVILSFIFTLPFAIFSWHVVEKPVLRLKKLFLT